nr:DUF4132 domain-containing protein [Clostridia bacterium]
IIDDISEIFGEDGQTIDGVKFRIVIDETGKPSLVSEKDGKILKSIPAKLKKNETVTALSDKVRTLSEQYRRTRVMLERAMEERQTRGIFNTSRKRCGTSDRRYNDTRTASSLTAQRKGIPAVCRRRSQNRRDHIKGNTVCRG